MKISELESKQGKIHIEVEVINVEEPREFERFGQKGKVAKATAKDESGEIKLTLWNDEVDAVREGDKIKITNGYVSEYRGEKQLTAGRFGKLEVIKE